MRPRIIVIAFSILFIVLMAGLAAGQSGVRAVVVNEQVNIRVAPAIGAEVIATVQGGYEFNIVDARSGDNQWIRVDYLGMEGWVNLVPLVVLSGDLASLPVADPRTIPFGGFESPRAGSSSVTGSVAARATNGVRLRAGPSTAYPTLGNLNANQGITLTGRTASNAWVQGNLDGTLGWLSARYIEILSGDINQLPVGGIVADAPPLSAETAENFIAILNLMLDRLNLAQPSLDTMRARWTDAAINGRAVCQEYPARPSDIQIPAPLMAAFYTQLEPLRVDFNIAMANVRLAIDLFIEVCNQPGTGNPVGTATAQGALEAVNLADQQFASLRQRIRALIPDISVGADECLLEYGGRIEVLPIIRIGQLYTDNLTPRRTAIGYCFDVAQGQILNVQALPLPGADLQLFLAVSPLDNPTNFLAATQGGLNALASAGPIQVENFARYVLLLGDLGAGNRVPQGQFALRITDITFLTTLPVLTFDPATGSVIIISESAAQGTPVFGPTATPQPGAPVGVVCPSTAFTCNQLLSCDEAYACLSAGNFSLDADNDGVPCEGPPLNCTPR